MASPTLNHSDSTTSNANTQRALKKDRKMSIDGYSSNVFEGKPAQMTQVAQFIAEKGFLPQDLIEAEVAWFYK